MLTYLEKPRRPAVVFAREIREIDIVADPTRLERLDLAVLTD